MPRTVSDERPGIALLLRDTADSLVVLIAAHLKISNLELIGDLQARARQLAVVVGIGLVGMVGYLLLMAGVAESMTGRVGRPLAFVSLGLAHFSVAALAALVVALRRRRASPIASLMSSVGQSVNNVANAAMPMTSHVQERSHDDL